MTPSRCLLLHHPEPCEAALPRQGDLQVLGRLQRDAAGQGEGGGSPRREGDPEEGRRQPPRDGPARTHLVKDALNDPYQLYGINFTSFKI